MNPIIGGSNYSVWLGGIEYLLNRSCPFGFDADTAQGVELSKRISLEKLQEAAIQLGYMPCKDISIEPGTLMGCPNVQIGHSCNMPEAPAQEAFVALGKHIEPMPKDHLTRHDAPESICVGSQNTWVSDGNPLRLTSGQGCTALGYPNLNCPSFGSGCEVQGTGLQNMIIGKPI